MSLERRERFETLERLGELRRRLEDLTRRYAGADDLSGWTPDLDIIDADSHFVIRGKAVICAANAPPVIFSAPSNYPCPYVRVRR